MNFQYRSLVLIAFAALAPTACLDAEPTSEERSRSGLEGAGDEPLPADPCAEPMCAPGTRLADPDGDGCFETCEPVGPCAEPTCAQGTRLADPNGDGCFETCEPVTCLPPPACPVQHTLTDADGDGCANECTPCGFAILCQGGTVQYDSNGDGCYDRCR